MDTATDTATRPPSTVTPFAVTWEGAPGPATGRTLDGAKVAADAAVAAVAAVAFTTGVTFTGVATEETGETGETRDGAGLTCLFTTGFSGDEDGTVGGTVGGTVDGAVDSTALGGKGGSLTRR